MGKEQLLSDGQIFELARELAKGKIQQEITNLLEEKGRKVTVMAVNKMIKGEKKMLRLAMDWILLSSPAKVEWEGGEQPTRHFKLLEQ